MFLLVILIFILAVLTCYKTSLGLMIYFLIRLCVPISARVFGFSFNTCCFTIFTVLSIHVIFRDLKNISYREREFFRVTFVLVLGLFILCLFAPVVPLPFQYSNLLKFILTEFFPAYYIILFIRTKDDFVLLNKFILYAALFTACYGIFTFITKSNPFFEIMASEDILIRDYSLSERAGMAGQAVGIYNDSIFLSLVSLLFIVYLFGKDFLNNKILSLTLILTLIDLFLTTKRSAFFCLIPFILLLYWDRKYRKKVLKIVLICLLGGGICILCFSQLKGFQDMILSTLFFWDDKLQSDLGVYGSSTEMRIDQFLNIIKIAKEYILQGLGYSFPSYYYTEIYDVEQYGLDPDFWGFESFILKTLVSSGLIGLLIWWWTFYRILHIMQSGVAYGNKYFLAFMLSYLMAVVMTDTSGSMYLFFLFVVLNLQYIHFFTNEHENESNKSLIEKQ